MLAVDPRLRRGRRPGPPLAARAVAVAGGLGGARELEAHAAAEQAADRWWKARSSPQPRLAGQAGVAQLVEHLICNQAVRGSSPLSGFASVLRPNSGPGSFGLWAIVHSLRPCLSPNAGRRAPRDGDPACHRRTALRPSPPPAMPALPSRSPRGRRPAIRHNGVTRHRDRPGERASLPAQVSTRRRARGRGPARLHATRGASRARLHITATARTRCWSGTRATRPAARTLARPLPVRGQRRCGRHAAAAASC